MSIKVRELIRELRPKRVEFSNGSHRFWFSDEDRYAMAQKVASKQCALPNSMKMRGWSRGSAKGEMFVEFKLH